MTTMSLRVVAIIYSTISRMINCFFIFEFEERDNIVVQAWQPRGFIIIATIPRPNFEPDQ